MLELILFYVFATVAVVSALLVITRHNVVHSAAFLGATLFAVAGIFLTLHAEFLAGVQVIVCVGGILVLFVFVIQPAIARGGMGELLIVAAIFAVVLFAERWIRTR